jgi:hypothetical protein
MFTIDVWEERDNQRSNNITIAEDLLLSGIEESKLWKSKDINVEALKRVADEVFGGQVQRMLGACTSNAIIKTMVAREIAKTSTKQGGVLEKKIFDGISESLAEHGITVRQAKSATELRPLRDGGLANNTEFKKLIRTTGKSKEQLSLKSIDGFIESPVEGYIFAKVKTGTGGHQDNVLIEANDFITWAMNEPKDKLYVVLIDGNKDATLYSRQTENIWVCDHKEFQEKMIEYVGK